MGKQRKRNKKPDPYVITSTVPIENREGAMFLDDSMTLEQNMSRKASALGRIESFAESERPKGRSKKGSGTTDVLFSTDIQVYDPELGVDDFLIPTERRELHRWYRYFYEWDEMVGAAIDQHTDVPLSRMRLNAPQMRNPERAKSILNFYEDMTRSSQLLTTVSREISHEYWLFGTGFLYSELEESKPGEADTVRYVHALRDYYYSVNGITKEELDIARRNLSTQGADLGKLTVRERAAIGHMQKAEEADLKGLEEFLKNYAKERPKLHGAKRWARHIIINPDFIDIVGYHFSPDKLIYLLPPDQTYSYLGRSSLWDDSQDTSEAEKMEIAQSMPDSLHAYLKEGIPARLNTEPSEGDFIAVIARTASQYEDRGSSLLKRCLRTLVYRDQLRSTQATINMRTRFPIHLLVAEGTNPAQLEALRQQGSQFLS